MEVDAATLHVVKAKLTPVFVGTDLTNVVNEGALLAAQKGSSHSLYFECVHG